MKMGLADFEYYGDKAKTEANRLQGYFTVGDIGYLAEDGFLFLCDRKSDMIISGGANIYPAEIEAEIIMNPKVADVAVFGIPDEEWGEQIKAVVQPADGVVAGRRAGRGDPGRARGQAGEDEVAEVHRFRRRAAARPQRQAAQAPSPRPLLGGRAARSMPGTSSDSPCSGSERRTRRRREQVAAATSASMSISRVVDLESGGSP